MSETIRPARTETYEHTVSGLLTKRAEVLREADVAAYRVAELRNDLAAIDRTLALLGYRGDADAVMPRHQRKRAFGRGVLTRRAFDALRKADGPLSGREVAVAIIEAEGADADDQAFVRETTDSVGRMLRKLRDQGRVRAIKDDRGTVGWTRCGENVWWAN